MGDFASKTIKQFQMLNNLISSKQELFLALFSSDFSGSFFYSSEDLSFCKAKIIQITLLAALYLDCDLKTSFPSAGRKMVRSIYNVYLWKERNIWKEKRLSVVPYFSKVVYNHIFVLYYHYLIKHSSYPCEKTDNLFQYPIPYSKTLILAAVDSTMWTPVPETPILL